MYNFCAFDLDGTLVDTLESLAYFCNFTLKSLGLDTIETEKYKQLVGTGAKNLVKGMLKTVGDSECTLFDKAYETYIREYNANCLYLAKPYDGIEEMLMRLKEQGVKMAVLSNKPHESTSFIIKSMFGADMFDACYGNREGIPRKPDPTALLGIMKDLGVTSGAYVGDSGTDMETGKNAGLYSIGVLWGFRERDELLAGGADLLVNTPMEIAEMILK